MRHDTERRSIETAATRAVKGLWLAMAARDWEAAARFVHPDTVVEWPQSRERIRGRKNFIELNRAYPGDWEIHVDVVEPLHEDGAVARVRVPMSGKMEYCIGIYRVTEGLILQGMEFWAAEYPAPEWRRAWVEPMEP